MSANSTEKYKGTPFAAYKDWNITGQRLVHGGWDITFEKAIPWYQRLFKKLACVFLGLISLGALCTQEWFIDLWYSANKSRIQHVAPSEKCIQAHLIDRIQTVPAVKGLYDRAKFRSITCFQLVQPTPEMRLDDSPGTACHGAGKIYVMLGRTEDQIFTEAIFEFTNRIHHQELPEEHFMVENYRNPDQYAQTMELTEYQGAIWHHAALKQAINEYGWDSRMDMYGHLLKTVWATPQQFWDSQKDTPHVKYYIDGWKDRQ